MNSHATAPCAHPGFGPLPRRLTTAVRIGGVDVGGGHPVVVQSMTNTDTADVASTTKQVAELWRAGSEMVRVTVNTLEAATAVPRIVMTMCRDGGNEILRIAFDGVGWERGVDLVGTDRLISRLCHQLRATLTSEGSGCLILVMPHDGGEHRHRVPD